MADNPRIQRPKQTDRPMLDLNRLKSNGGSDAGTSKQNLENMKVLFKLPEKWSLCDFIKKLIDVYQVNELFLMINARLTHTDTSQAAGCRHDTPLNGGVTGKIGVH